MEKPYAVIKASWLLNREGNEAHKPEILRHLSIAMNFFQKNNLLNHKIIPDSGIIDEDFEIWSNDFTDEGIQLMKTGYQKWLGRVDKGMDPSNTKILERELDKLRSVQ